MHARIALADGYSCTAGATAEGWFVAAKQIQSVDQQYVIDEKLFNPDIYPGFWQVRPDHDHQTWQQAAVGRRQSIQLIVVAPHLQQELVTSAEMVSEPATVKGACQELLLAWTEKGEAQWRLMLRRGQTMRALNCTSLMQRHPSIAVSEADLWVATEVDQDGIGTIQVYNESGRLCYQTPGRSPVLCGVKEDLFLLCEQLSGLEPRIGLHLIQIRGGQEIRRWHLSTDYINIHGDLLYSQKDQTLYISWESSPLWGRVGLHRTLHVWRLPNVTGSQSPGDLPAHPTPDVNTSSGRLEIEQESMGKGSNLTPSHAKLWLVGGSLAVAFRRFRYRGSNGYGWDVYMLRKENGIWGRPERISSNFGPPDANYAVVSQSLNTDTLLGVFPCCDNTLRFGKAFRHRVEVETIRPQPAVPLPAEVRAEYTIPFSIEQAGLAPKSPQGMPSQYTLIWGDLHRHSFHSKCSSPTEGSPRDVLRHLRDILGCQVLALTDHTSHMSDAEFVWHIDALEEVCGDTCLPLYGLENGPEDPYHDTKLFARTRLLFEKLRLFTCTYSDRAALYARLKAEFPPQSVLAVRHIDKMYPANFGPKQHQDLTQSWDPELEVAMQVVRNKDGISFLSEDAQDGWRFPANMLHCGAQFGFIGGSDHTTHPFCLTGFWVKEFSVDGVWEALLQRRTIACANGKVFLWALCNGQPLGQAIAASRVEVDAFVASAFGVGRACLMRNGVPIGWQELTDQQGQLRFSDQPPPGAYWYCVTVEAGTAKGKGVSLAHSSPWFVTVEP